MGRGGAEVRQGPGARREVATSPAFEPAEILALSHHCDGIKNCFVEHTYRWLDGSYRLLTARASECPAGAGGREPERTIRFEVPVSER